MNIIGFLSRRIGYVLKDAVIRETLGATSTHINRTIRNMVKTKEVTRCSGCGSEISKDVNICPYCGQKKLNKIENETEVEKETKKVEQLSNCPSCGAVLKADTKFCGNCGCQICK